MEDVIDYKNYRIINYTPKNKNETKMNIFRYDRSTYTMEEFNYIHDSNTIDADDYFDITSTVTQFNNELEMTNYLDSTNPQNKFNGKIYGIMAYGLKDIRKIKQFNYVKDLFEKTEDLINKLKRSSSLLHEDKKLDVDHIFVYLDLLDKIKPFIIDLKLDFDRNLIIIFKGFAYRIKNYYYYAGQKQLIINKFSLSDNKGFEFIKNNLFINRYLTGFEPDCNINLESVLLPYMRERDKLNTGWKII